MRSEDEQALVRSLSAKYPLFAESTIARWVAAEILNYRTATIQTYIPMLVRRSVDATLRELSRTEGTSADTLSLDHATV
jgi:phage terminase Nu1 subunit (DNA packaging protein)